MKRRFSAVIVAVLSVVSCAKEVDKAGSKSEGALPESTATPSASIAPIDQVPAPPVMPPATTSTGVITSPTAMPEQPVESKTERKPVDAPTVRPKAIAEPHARPTSLPPGVQEPSKHPSPKPVATSQAGRVVRFTCPSGEVPTQVMGGCMCGSEIANPCGPGVRVPDLRVEGKTCLFTCP